MAGSLKPHTDNPPKQHGPAYWVGIYYVNYGWIWGTRGDGFPYCLGRVEDKLDEAKKRQGLD